MPLSTCLISMILSRLYWEEQHKAGHSFDIRSWLICAEIECSEEGGTNTACDERRKCNGRR